MSVTSLQEVLFQEKKEMEIDKNVKKLQQNFEGGIL